ncbi:hypothetical protein PO909_000066 [Leuciscus waleckii]
MVNRQGKSRSLCLYPGTGDQVHTETPVLFMKSCKEGTMTTEDCMSGAFSANTANAEAADLRSELRSTEALLDDVLRRQSLLLSRVDLLHPASKPGATDDAAKVPASVATLTDPLITWTTVGAKDGRRCSIPFFTPDDDKNLLTLSNFYAPLETLQGAGLEVELGATNFPLYSTEKQPPIVSAAPASIHKSRKRSTSPMLTERSEKRRRCLSYSEVSGDIGCAPPVFPPATDASPGSSASNDDVIHSGSFSRLSDLATTAGAEPATPPGSRESQSSATHIIHQNLSTYMYNDTSLPQVLLLGDSSIKRIKLPACITYCLSNGKIGDFIKLLPKLKIVIIHTGINEIMDRQSARLHSDLEELCFQIESLGKRCILSGPFPSPSMGSEYFSRLYGLHQWLCHF